MTADNVVEFAEISAHRDTLGTVDRSTEPNAGQMPSIVDAERRAINAMVTLRRAYLGNGRPISALVADACISQINGERRR